MSSPQHGARKHSLLAPSHASVWTTCTASPQLVQANAYRIVEESSAAADEGTLAHEVCDALMRGGRAPYKATREMIDHAKQYVMFCKSLHPEGVIDPEGVEKEVPLFYRPEDNGHVDYFLAGSKSVHVVDYKFGKGIKVLAENNKQMASYAYSAILARKLECTSGMRVHMHIYQPRCQKDEGEGVASTWTTTLGALALFCEKEIGVPAQLIQDKADHLLAYQPSDVTCRWCAASAFCAARTEQLLSGDNNIRRMLASKPPINPPAPESLDDDRLSSILEHADGLIAWLNSVKGYALGRALKGSPISGTKLVAGKGSRSWGNPEAAKKLMAKHGISPFTEAELISPAKAEQGLKGAKAGNVALKTLDLFIERTEGAPVLAPASDVRRDWAPVDVEKEFAPVLALKDLL